MKYTIQVTEVDIAEGERGSCVYCPVALAISRAIGIPPGRLFPLSIYVGGYVASVSGITYALPDVARKAVEDFDRGNRILPFEFEINI